ncbi:MAG TPA: hypothetical protein VGN52_12760 [Burkholderiales bacterium]|jgi:hypothetical protein
MIAIFSTPLRALCITIAALCILPAHAEEAPGPHHAPAQADATRSALVEKVITAAGLREQMASIEKSMRESFAASATRTQKGETVTPEARARLQRMGSAVADAYRRELFVERIAASLSEGEGNGRLATVLAELDKPLVKRMSAAEKQPLDPAAMRDYFTRTRSQPLPPARLALMERIDAASGASELATQVTITTTKLLVYATPGMEAERAARASAEIDARLPATRAQVRAQLLAQFAYTYRNVNDADLELYTRENEGESLRWLNNRIAAALGAQFRESALKMARAFHDIMTPGGAAAVT